MNLLGKTLVCGLLAVVTATAADHTYLLKLEVQAPEELQNSLISKLSLEQRKSPDVRLIDSGEDYTIQLICMSVSDLSMLDCSCNLLRPNDVDYFADFLKPTDPGKWKSFVGMLKNGNQLVRHSSVRTAGYEKLDSFATHVADDFNVEVLESDRKFRTERDKLDTSKPAPKQE